mmetsp:Transcript_100698/g.323331  ORF Transcript_100698/g.323331 Transcript_100698/m.323331 type:complete len:209 (-) Transcript_100698:337-963(-)
MAELLRTSSFAESLFSLLGRSFALDEKTALLGHMGGNGYMRDLRGSGLRSEWAKGLSSEKTEKQEKSPRQKAEAQAQTKAAADLVSEFCGYYPALRVEPSDEEMEALLRRCLEMKIGAVAKAFLGELSMSSGDTSWQPRLRALRALAYFGGQSRFGRMVLRKCEREARDILQYMLDEVPQCRPAALQLLQRSEEVDDEATKATSRVSL